MWLGVNIMGDTLQEDRVYLQGVVLLLWVIVDKGYRG
jgi:hypothetical protein